MRANVRLFREDDAYDLELHECFLADQTVRIRTVNAAKAGAYIITLCGPESDAPMACLGGGQIFSGVFHAFALVGTDALEHPIYYAKATKEIIDSTFEKFSLNRMQIAIRADQGWGHRWAKYLGFQFEGTLRNYGEENKDHHMFAKVKNANG